MPEKSPNSDLLETGESRSTGEKFGVVTELDRAEPVCDGRSENLLSDTRERGRIDVGLWLAVTPSGVRVNAPSGSITPVPTERDRRSDRAGDRSCHGRPPFPWRPQSLGPAPYTQRQAVRPWQVPATPVPLKRDVIPPVTGNSPPQRVTTRKPESQFPTGCGIHIAATERFLDELIRVESQEEGPVRDCILGAEVVGSQSTETQVRVQLIPDPDQARFDIVLRGTTRNQTENRTSQAVIQADGNHRFDIAKSVQFDGKQLLTRSPAAWLYPCQRNRSAFTPASAIPILGPLVSQYALGIAEQQRPEAERITANRITQRVAPQFDKAIDSRLASLNRGLLQSLPQILPQFGIETPSTRVHTTDQELIASLAWDSVRTVPEYNPPPLRSRLRSCMSPCMLML